jgi:hypothetical protein
MNAREKRTIRLAAIGIGIYLAVFFGVRGWKYLEHTRSEYRDMLTQAQRLKRDLRPAENRVLLTWKLKETFHLDPKNLSRASLPADVSAAIQRAAGSVKIQIGHIRESAGRSAGKELGSMQLEGVGPVPAVMSLLHRLDTLGYPVVVDSLQITSDTKPGNIKVNLSIVILDFDQWKSAEVPNA